MFSGNTSQVSSDQLYVEDVFSTWLYTGNGSTQTITNGIDLAGKGGLVWIKSRSAATNNFLFDTTRGVNVELNSNTTDANATLANSVTAFNSNGFAISSATGIGVNAATYASWTFREAPKFFDVVTYTGDGTNNRSIAHNLGIAPGMIIVKNVTSAQSWLVYHRSTGTGNYLFLNGTDAVSTDANGFPSVSSTAFVPTANQSAFALNTSGQTFVAYLFAHDTASDGVIQCGSYVRTGSSVSVNLGWEPQWVLVKKATDINGFGGSNWAIADNMRGFDVTSWSRLNPNTTNAETTGVSGLSPNSTGFTVTSASGQADSGETYIYIAIRRGPMRTPTSGTSVFSPVAQTSTANQLVSTGFPVDLLIERPRASTSDTWVFDRLRGSQSTSAVTLSTSSTNAESNTSPYGFGFDRNNGVTDNWGYGSSTIYWNFRRAPSFFDEVCYTGDGATNRAINHNLGAVPELIINKPRSYADYWEVYHKDVGLNSYMYLNSTDAPASSTGNWSAMTATTFGAGYAYGHNRSGQTYVNYLFASCPGVSKVGSFTGNGSTQTINCGFAAGARFVMIKRTDSTGDWYVWDTARGIVAANDPHLSLNTTAAEVTTDDTIDTDSSGFVVNQVAATNVNVSSATYIYLAIA